MLMMTTGNYTLSILPVVFLSLASCDSKTHSSVLHLLHVLHVYFIAVVFITNSPELSIYIY